MPLPTETEIEKAVKFFSHKAQPIGSITTLKDFNKVPLRSPQVCFMGRSNVGKSSLLNALVGIPRLANVSSSPGCTRSINFYKILNQVTLVDLPGFGHAKVSKGKSDNWLDLVNEYFIRSTVLRAFLLVDSRRGILPVDIETMALCAKSSTLFQIILTKVDELTLDQVEKIRREIHNKVAKKPSCFPEVLVSSAHRGYGIDVLRARCIEAFGLRPLPKYEFQELDDAV